MLEFLAGGVIKGRPHRTKEEDRLNHARSVKELRGRSLTDVAIAKRLKTSYYKVAKRSISATNY